MRPQVIQLVLARTLQQLPKFAPFCHLAVSSMNHQLFTSLVPVQPKHQLLQLFIFITPLRPRILRCLLRPLMQLVMKKTIMVMVRWLLERSAMLAGLKFYLNLIG